MEGKLETFREQILEHLFELLLGRSGRNRAGDIISFLVDQSRAGNLLEINQSIGASQEARLRPRRYVNLLGLLVQGLPEKRRTRCGGDGFTDATSNES